jgi:nephrocystin-4
MEHKMKTAHLPGEMVNILSDPSKPEWAKKQSLRQIETLRDYTKPYIIDQVLKDHIKSMKQLYIVPGTPSFFKYILKNPFSSRTVFTINLVDQDKLYLGETKEFKLVNNLNFEWEFWHSRRKCEAPSYWDSINKRDEIMLEPGEEVPLLFKYITFREYDPRKESSELYIKERPIHIIFEYSSHREGKGQMFETKLVVSPKKPPIDFSMTFYEPPNSHASITIPASFYVDPHQAYCSDSNVI